MQVGPSVCMQPPAGVQMVPDTHSCPEGQGGVQTSLNGDPEPVAKLVTEPLLDALAEVAALLPDPEPVLEETVVADAAASLLPPTGLELLQFVRSATTAAAQAAAKTMGLIERGGYFAGAALASRHHREVASN
jgi:hypothetical protein